MRGPNCGSGEITKDEEVREHAVRTSEARLSVVPGWDEVYHRYRLLAMMAQGAAFGGIVLMDRFEGDVTALIPDGAEVEIDPPAGIVRVLDGVS